jgi:uncharacterized membrane protein
MIGLIIIAAVAYAGAIVAFGRGPQFVNTNLFGSVVNFLGALVPLSLFVLAMSAQKSLGSEPRKGLIYALLGGLAIAVFTIALTKIFSTGQNVSFVTPLVYGGAVLIASLVGIFVFKEQPNLFAVMGLVLIVVGIGAIAYSAYLKEMVR